MRNECPICLKLLYKTKKIINIIEAYLHYKNGIYYKYPNCCIKQFCDEIKRDISPGTNRQLKYFKNWDKISKYFETGKGFIPCNRCIEDLLEKRILGRKNIYKYLDFTLKD